LTRKLSLIMVKSNVDGKRSSAPKILIYLAFSLILLMLGILAAMFPSSHPRGLAGHVVEFALTLGPQFKQWDLESYRARVDKGVTPLTHSQTQALLELEDGTSVSSLLLTPDGTFNSDEYLNKPSFYVSELTTDSILLATGDGSFLSMEGIETSKYNFKSIPSNMGSLILPPEVREPGLFSVKGLHVNQKYVYVSFSHRHDLAYECWSTSLARASKSPTFLKFERFWTSPGCVAPQWAGEFQPLQAGGGISSDEDLGVVFLGTGDYRNWGLAQSSYSTFGKVISISESDASDFHLVAVGLRNPQSLEFEGGSLFVTEQGPMGGDEVNMIPGASLVSNALPVNFGWPIASYGDHYEFEVREGSPLLKSHLEHGFVEPAIYWTPSIAISSIQKIHGHPGKYLVGSLGSTIDEGDLSIQVLDCRARIICQKGIRLKVTERVRDMELLGSGKLLASLDSGKLLIIEVRSLIE
jgi:hypothetical protein